MILRVENLGPLKQASIDLSKSLILLTGPNNTGKTYLAWSVYGLHRMRSVKGLDALIQPAVDAMLERGESTLDLAAFMAERGHECGTLIGDAYRKRVAHDFAIHPDRFRDARFTLEIKPGDARGQGFTLIDVQEDGWLSTSTTWSTPGSGDAMYHVVLCRSQDHESLKDSISQDGTVDESKTLPLTTVSRDDVGIRLRLDGDLVILTSLLPWPVIFPAERIATNLFAKELSLQRTKLVDNLLERAASPTAEQADLREYVQARAQRYPSPIQDSLQVAIDLERLSQQESPYADLADELERAVLGGTVAVSAHAQLSFSPASAPDVDVSIQHAGSVVKSLASLVFHLRHLAHEGQLVIIDEPELNLHPDNQRKVARVLAKAVNRGLRILASTHSDYLIRELNHLIMLSHPGEAMARAREELGYTEDELLSPERLGVYFFDGTGNRELPVDERGFEVATIEQAINDMNATSQTIYAALLDD